MSTLFTVDVVWVICVRFTEFFLLDLVLRGVGDGGALGGAKVGVVVGTAGDVVGGDEGGAEGADVEVGNVVEER